MLIHVLGLVSQCNIWSLLWVHLRFILFYYYFSQYSSQFERSFKTLTFDIVKFPFSLGVLLISDIWPFFFLPVPRTPSRCHCKSDLFSTTFKKEQVESLRVAVMCALDTGLNSFQSHQGGDYYKNVKRLLGFLPAFI